MGLLKKVANVATGGMFGLGSKLLNPVGPDVGGWADAQGQNNIATARTNARLNRINEYTPYGSRTYRDLGNDQWESSVSLNPADQSLLDARRRIAGGLSGNAESSFSTPYSMDGVPQMPGTGDFSADRDALTNAVYSRYTRYLDPRMERGEEALRTRLANQGVMEGSEAYKNAFADFNEQRDMTYGDIYDRAIRAGSDEQSRLFGLGERAHAQGIADYERERYAPVREIGYLDAMDPTVPQFGATPNVGVNPVDIAGMMQNQYNVNAQQRNNLLSGLFGLGGAAIMSDRRTKRDIERIGVLDSGIPVYRYRYVGDTKLQVGVMADEVEQINPGAVVTGDDGFKRVNYGML